MERQSSSGPAGQPHEYKRKRAKIDTLLNSDLLSDAGRSKLVSDYSAAEPFRHCVLAPLFTDPSQLQAVADEITGNLDATYKETDLFKLYQTIDLANLDKDDAAQASLTSCLPTLLQLRDSLYDESFRHMIQEITGLARGLTAVPCCRSDITRALSFAGRMSIEKMVKQKKAGLPLTGRRLLRAYRPGGHGGQRFRARVPLAVPRRRDRHSSGLVHSLPHGPGTTTTAYLCRAACLYLRCTAASIIATASCRIGRRRMAGLWSCIPMSMHNRQALGHLSHRHWRCRLPLQPSFLFQNLTRWQCLRSNLGAVTTASRKCSHRVSHGFPYKDGIMASQHQQRMEPKWQHSSNSNRRATCARQTSC